MAINKKRVVLLALWGITGLGAMSASYADALKSAQACLYTATNAISGNIQALPGVLAQTNDPADLNGGYLTLGVWDGLVLTSGDDSGANGFYHRVWGWHTTSDQFYEIAYLGRGCGMLSYSKLVCRVYIDDDIFTLTTDATQYTQPAWSFRCSVCRNKALKHNGAEIVEQNVTTGRLAYSALQSDQSIMENQSANAVSVVLSGLVDDPALCLPAYDDIDRT